MLIPFNKPYIPLRAIKNMAVVAISGTIAGNGTYTKRCHRIFEDRFGFKKVLLTTSCSDALEMTALLCRIEPGDEVIMPSFTFMSTANAFLLRGAKVLFADTQPDIPNIDPAEIEKLITPRTKLIVVVHYGGVACDMDRIMDIAHKNNLLVVEDAAHAIESAYRGRLLGSIGHLGTFSFHETKNITCGEGGLLIINDERFIQRAEIIWEKGTNRAAFYRGEVDKYGWVDIGSSYLPSDALASFLYLQLKTIHKIQDRRIDHWKRYHKGLEHLEEKGYLKRPVIPEYATVNGNMYYFIMSSPEERDKMLHYLKSKGVQAVFHYLPLHSSPYFKDKHDGRSLPNTDRFSSCIVRLPFYYGLKKRQIDYIVKMISTCFH